MTPHPLDTAAMRHYRRWMAKGNRVQAETSLRRMLAREANLPAAHSALARLRWPGPDYRAWLAWLHRQLAPRVYVEIGVESGTSLALVQPDTQVIAIDPEPVGDPLHACPGVGQLFTQTSAAFFAQSCAPSGLSHTGFNLAFIDGDHRFESVLDDFIALERHAAPGAVVLLHDTLPLTESTSGGERHTGFYSGDAWKVVPCLRALRPDLRLTTLPTAPTGLTVITGLDPDSRVLETRRALIHQVYARLPSAHAVAHPHTLFNLGENDPAWLARWLAHGQ